MNEQQYADAAQEAKARLYRTARLYLGSGSAALDAVDEAIYKGFLSCKKLRQPEHLVTWLTRILINVCNDALRRRGRVTAVERLPRQLRAVVVLRYFSGYTLAETAEILGLPPGTVSTRQRKALNLLRLELSEEEN